MFKIVLYDRLNLGLYLILVYNLQFIRNRPKNLTKLNGTEEGLTYPTREVIIAGLMLYMMKGIPPRQQGSILPTYVQLFICA